MKIAVFGGDKRMLFAARACADEGHEVLLAGFDSLLSLCEIKVCSPEEAADLCDCAVLPVRPIADGCLNAPFSQHPVSIGGLLERLGEKPIMTGCARMIRPYARGRVYDYSVEEEFVLRNAELTAEGAIGILLNEYEAAVCGTEILVTGYGRIGKVLTQYLASWGAKVAVAARNPADRETIIKNGLTAVDYPQIDFSSYRVIINTVPAMVMDADAVAQMRPDAFLIDLASVPGGIDFDAVRDRDISCVHALSLPGKTAPLTAGIIIKDTVLNILSREGLLG